MYATFKKFDHPHILNEFWKMATNGKMTNGGSHGAKKKAAHERYAIGRAILEPGVHHESFEKLWETKWKAPVGDCLLLALPTSNTYQGS